MMLPGKTILVTGVASGIWLATAEVSRALGADVVRADVVRVDVRGPAQPVGAVHQADLSHADGVAAFVAKPPRRIDALCNVAGVSGVAGAAKTLAINFSGLCALTEAVLVLARLMQRFRFALSGDGAVVPRGIVTTQPDRAVRFVVEPR